MSDSFTCFVSGEPVPKQRPRLGKGKVYTPDRTKAWESLIRHRARERMNMEGYDLFTESVAVTLDFRYGNRGADLDNLVKAVWDALNGVVWEDDVQVVELHALVRRGTLKPAQGVQISVCDISGEGG
jgi:Holliday junction resolvase RusA-like endonuclease